MEDLIILDRPRLSDPVLIMAFKGWNDAGCGASYAAEHVVSTLRGERFAYIDSEEYFDFTESRPYTKPVGSYQRSLTWPQNDFFHARHGDRDLIVLVGTEPNLRWKRYSGHIVQVAREFGAREALALGALLADTPHTRPVPISGGATTPELAERLAAEGIKPSGYEGPTGIVTVSGQALAEAGIPNGSIWAAVPHYISASPNPMAAAALVRRLNSVLSLGIALDQLEAESAVYQHRIASALEGNLEAQHFVQQLEQRADEEGEESEAAPEEPMNTEQADRLIQSIEEFLRDRSDRPEEEGSGD